MIYTICNTHLNVSVNTLGAELWSVQGIDGTQYLWQGDPQWWGDRSPNLFPFVGRLTDETYRMDGQQYAMKIHGFAAAQEFAVIEQSGNRLVLELRENPETLQQYPRRFSFRVAYTLTDSRLDICYQVENCDEKTLYFGIGGHPGFCVPLEDGKDFTDYRLRFTDICPAKRVGFTKKCFRNGQDEPFLLENGTVLPLRHDLFDQDAIVLKDMSREVTLESGDGHWVTVSYPQMPYLGIWHRPLSDAPYVCIEPWATLPAVQDVISEFEKDLIPLAPDQSWSNEWSITVGETVAQ